jgi:hypothetical protein
MPATLGEITSSEPILGSNIPVIQMIRLRRPIHTAPARSRTGDTAGRPL